MKKTRTLPATEREFFRTVAQAAFANPFSPARLELDRKIAGTSEPLSWDELLPRVKDMVGERLRQLESSGGGELGLYPAEDREILRTVFLFDLYHRHLGELDSFILKQRQAGDQPLSVPFARELLGRLQQIGFDAAEKPRYLAILYQLRRAFHFIDQALVGLSPSMQTLRLQLWNNIFTCNLNWYEQHLWNRMEDFSTLLLGETGTGKGAAAAAIGRSGFIPFDERTGCFAGSFTRNFISLNLSQYPESLLESELFGHKKGAFTGAIEHHEGIFGRCTPLGSIFLDEIGDVSIPVQIKLLQILQERTFSPVGSHDKLRFQGRVIAATNRPLDQLRQRGEFRDDFYYRLCSDTVVVPPLRIRLQEDPRELEELVASILGRLIGPAAVPFARLVCDVLHRDLGHGYLWPGNVRELEQAVRRIILTRHYRGDTPAPSGASELEQLTEALSAGTLAAPELLAGYCRHLFRRHGTYEEVARRTGLDRRTVKKYIQGT